MAAIDTGQMAKSISAGIRESLEKSGVFSPARHPRHPAGSENGGRFRFLTGKGADRQARRSARIIGEATDGDHMESHLGPFETRHTVHHNDPLEGAEKLGENLRAKGYRVTVTHGIPAAPHVLTETMSHVYAVHPDYKHRPGRSGDERKWLHSIDVRPALPSVNDK